MKKSVLFLGIVFALILCACSKEEPGPSGGLNDTTWVPVWSKGEIVAPEYTVSWDGPVDDSGCLNSTYERDGRIIEYSRSFVGYHFYRDKRTNLYSTFSPGLQNTGGTPGKYYVEGGKLYLERIASSGSPYSSASHSDPEPTGVYESYVLEEFTPDRMTFSGVTYEKRR